jgi:hypothetical protein
MTEDTTCSVLEQYGNSTVRKFRTVHKDTSDELIEDSTCSILKQVAKDVKMRKRTCTMPLDSVSLDPVSICIKQELLEMEQ